MIAKFLLPYLMQLLFATTRKRITYVNGSEKEFIVSDQVQSVLFAFWHGKMLTGWQLSRMLYRKRRIACVVSLSKDGEILSHALLKLGFELIRGSSSRGKEIVKAEMVGGLMSGKIVVITPDGPKGERHVFKYGSVRIASEQQVPIIFAKIHHEKKWQLNKSWDRFEIPKPFSRIDIQIRKIEVPKFEHESALQLFSNSLTKELAD